MFKGLLMDPAFLAGASILGANGNISKGLLGASGYMNAMTQNQMMQQQIAQRQRQQEALARQRQILGQPARTEMMGPPHMGKMQPQQVGATGIFAAQTPEQRQQVMQQAALAGNNPLASLAALTPKPEAKTSLQKEYAQAVAQGFKGTLFDYSTALKRSGATNVTQYAGAPLSPGQKKIDEAVATEIAEYGPGGKSADTEKMISQLDEVYEALGDEDKNLTGPIIGKTPDTLLNLVNPEAVDTREAVEEVVQRNLKAILGAQFTAKEGERLISRAYNPSLDEATNRKRVGRLIAQIKAAHETKKSAAEYFRKNGTMRGWEGKQYTFDDFYEAIEDEQPKKSYNLDDIDKLLKKYGG